MKAFSARRRSMMLIRLFTAALFFVFLFFFFWKYDNGLYTDPVLSLRINEVCVTGLKTLEGDTAVYEDYVELYNPTEEYVSLDGLYLSDDPSEPLLSALPSVEVEPGGYLIVYALGEGDAVSEGTPSVSFGLTEEETLLLTWVNETEDGTVTTHTIDSVYIPSSLASGAVYAAVEDGKDTYAALRPSPAVSNEDSPRILGDPVFLTPGGFYEDSVEVVLSASSGLTIRYTLDGSEPKKDSAVYTGPLTLTDPSFSPNVYSAREDIASADQFYEVPDEPVDKAVVVRAAAFDEEGNRSNTVISTYFVDFNEKEGYENAAVLSLTADPEALFSSENGIYVLGSLYDSALADGLIYPELPWSELMDYTNYYLEGMSSERPAHVELFSAYGDLLLDQECGIRIRGNASRNFPQKSFTLYSRNRYEKEAFDPTLFGTGISYPSLILNNSQTLKKVFFFSLVEDRNAAVQRYIPCQVFLNGEYWGMYYLMERYSAEYLEGHYNVPTEGSLLIKDTRYVADGDPEEITRYRELREYLDQADFSSPEAYEKLLEMMDMQSFIDWMCTNIYIANTDTKPLENNVYTWQSTLPDYLEYNDGKWRWMLYDLDDSLAVGTALEDGDAYTMDSFTDHAAYASRGFLDDAPMTALMENEDFRRQFVLTFLDMANENFRADRVLPLLDEIEEEYASWADLSWERWNTSPQNKTFSEQVEELRIFFENRYEYIVPYLAGHFSLTGDLVSLTLSADFSGENSQSPEQEELQGAVTLNTLNPDLTAGSWQGQYYTDYPVTLTAQAPDGFVFAGWEISGGAIVEGTADSASIQLQLETDTSVRAVFVPA